MIGVELDIPGITMLCASFGNIHLGEDAIHFRLDRGDMKPVLPLP